MNRLTIRNFFHLSDWDFGEFYPDEFGDDEGEYHCRICRQNERYRLRIRRRARRGLYKASLEIGSVEVSEWFSAEELRNPKRLVEWINLMLLT